MSNVVLKAAYERDDIDKLEGNDLKDAYVSLFSTEEGQQVLNDMVTFTGFPNLNFSQSEQINGFASGLQAMMLHIMDRASKEEVKVTETEV